MMIKAELLFKEMQFRGKKKKLKQISVQKIRKCLGGFHMTNKLIDSAK